MSKILIIGDSQAQGAGSVLADYYRNAGNEVELVSKSGASIEAIVKMAKPANYDKVVIFAGGNGTPTVNAVQDLLDIYPGADWIGPPPATLITDLGHAQAVFGGKVDGPAYWFQTSTADDREKANNFLSAVVPQYGGKYHDWRKFGLGDPFPAQPDGIHISKPTAKIAFSNGIPLGINLGGIIALAALGILAYKIWRGRK